MTSRPECEATRWLVPELAVGTAAGNERAQALAHLGRCMECRRELAAMTEVVDELLLLAPSEEPAAGFESAVLARLAPDLLDQPAEREGDAPSGGPAPAASDEGAAPPGKRWRRGRPRGGARARRAVLLAVVSAVVALTAALTTLVAWRATKDDRDLADDYRQTLRTAHGKGLSAAPVRTAGGEEAGTMFAYQGSPSWVYATFRTPPEAGRYRVHLLARDGRCLTLRPFQAEDGSIAWGSTITVPVRDITAVQFVRADEPMLTAQFG